MLVIDMLLEVLIFVLVVFLIITASGTFYVWWKGYHKPDSHTRQRLHYKRHHRSRF